MNVRSRLAALALVGSLAAAALQLTACPGLIGCGVAPAEQQANVEDGGVSFDPVLVGQTQQLEILFQDSVDVSETITGATLTGPDAAEFTVLSTFPMSIPAGQQVMVELEFAPTQVGTAQATLVLETMKMGPSPVLLTGTATAGD